MAEPPKPERPSQGESAPEPDFSPFEDWLIDGPAGEWPKPWEPEQELTEKQKQIVAANAALLLDRDAWFKKVQAFEAAISALPNEADRKLVRAKYAIRFDHHLFEDGDKDFTHCAFPCLISFYGANFGDGDVRFFGVTFGKGDVWFFGATFGKGGVWFNGANFGDGDVWFNRANFGEGDVSFSEATFGEGDVVFGDMIFRSSPMSASGMKVAGNFYVRSHFHETVNFSQLDVKGTASFSGSRFETVPDLRGAKFVRPPEVARMAVPPPRLALPKALAAAGRFIRWYRGIENASAEDNEMEEHQKGDPGSDVEEIGLANRSPIHRSWLSRTVAATTDGIRRVAISIFCLAADPEDVSKFRKLKVMALAANDHEKDGEFFAGEMLAKRGTETTGFFGLLFNTIYWWLSDFGQSFVRPIGWLIASYLVFAAACLYLIRDTLTLSDRLWFAADYSFRNMLPLFGSLFRFASAPTDHVSWYQKTYDCLGDAGVDIDQLISLGIAQSMIGTVLLFLLLLALRNKFRLK